MRARQIDLTVCTRPAFKICFVIKSCDQQFHTNLKPARASAKDELRFVHCSELKFHYFLTFFFLLSDFLYFCCASTVTIKGCSVLLFTVLYDSVLH